MELELQYTELSCCEAGESVTLTLQRKAGNAYEEKAVTLTLGSAQSAAALSSRY